MCDLVIDKLPYTERYASGREASNPEECPINSKQLACVALGMISKELVTHKVCRQLHNM